MPDLTLLKGRFLNSTGGKMGEWQLNYSLLTALHLSNHNFQTFSTTASPSYGKINKPRKAIAFLHIHTPTSTDSEQFSIQYSDSNNAYKQAQDVT
ncbi:hypothetical protein Nepgr_027427 [Nepenthes gracilis]|uniref:Uncharacterized protein n=1 Tax=Nepenthes gracilis TaxID=150966 RepID=A0AAD3TAC0_NEPGR|nr:hypothetical protein Nepgr_027427 [Nepenthes gracilis]